MALLNRNNLIGIYNAKQSSLLSDEMEMNFASERLHEAAENFSYLQRYDIFLSHSYDDARVVKIIKEMLEDQGFKVYVDWIEDPVLDRRRVTKYTASVLRNRMDNCSSLVYLTSQSAKNSSWMPWELGYMDARASNVAVAPIMENDETFYGREYLGLYPYLDLTGESFYIHADASSWVTFSDWMKGSRP